MIKNTNWHYCLIFILMIQIFTGYRVAHSDNTVTGSTVGGDVVGRDKFTILQPKPESLLKKATGRWQLATYNEITKPGMAPYFEIEEGSLTVDERGVAVWTVLVKDKYGPANYGPLRMTSAGQITPGGRMLEKTGGEYNNTEYLGEWQLDMRHTDLTIRGWATGEKSDPFTISADGELLVMKNSRCSLTWFRAQN